MSKAKLFVIFLVVITLLGSMIKNLSEMAGLFNFMPLLRDPLLVVLSIYGASKLNFYESRAWSVFIAATLGFVIPYILIAMIEDRAVIGLYYIRLYLFPLLFFMGAWGVLQDTSESPRSMLRAFLHWNSLLFITATVLYALLQIVPTLRSQLFGPDLLPSAWFISGGTWMRMGLPLSGPNTLGLVFALNAFVFISLLLTQRTLLERLDVGTGKLLFATTLSLLGLVLTFSRSSMLLLIVTVPLLLLLPSAMNFSKLLKFAGLAWMMLGLLILLLLAVDETSNGFVARWIVLNTKFNDPSMLGHVNSIVEAFDKLYEYVLWGYPKGTVGPKAILFSSIMNNVENSFLAVVYDMGIPGAILYGIAVSSLFLTGYRHRLQRILLIGFFPPYFLLPYVFEADALIYFSFVYLLLAILFTQTSSSDQEKSAHGSKRLVKYPVRTTVSFNQLKTNITKSVSTHGVFHHAS